MTDQPPKFLFHIPPAGSLERTHGDWALRAGENRFAYMAINVERSGTGKRDRAFSYGISVCYFNPSTGSFREVARYYRVLSIYRPEGTTVKEYFELNGLQMKCYVEFWSRDDCALFYRLEADAKRPGNPDLRSQAALGTQLHADLVQIEAAVVQHLGSINHMDIIHCTLDNDPPAVNNLLAATENIYVPDLSCSRDGTYRGAGQFLYSKACGMMGAHGQWAAWEYTKHVMLELKKCASALREPDHNPANDALFTVIRFCLLERMRPMTQEEINGV